MKKKLTNYKGNILLLPNGKYFRQLLFATLFVSLLSPLPTLQAEITGLQVVTNVYNRATGNDTQSTLRMTLQDNNGQSRVRTIKQFSKKFGRDEKSNMFFLSPADVRNTSFMNWSYGSGRDDDQWIYLPALKNVKRISSDSKSDYFMGSDFTYDDLGDRHPSKDTHKILLEETYNGEQCYVIESRPKDKNYMYSRTITWIIKDKWIGLKKDFYDEDGKKMKTLTVRNYKKISGYWIILSSKMYSIEKKHTTLMDLSNVLINRGIPNYKFTTNNMKRGI